MLKAGAMWPSTAKVYCHRVGGWPDDADIIEDVAVRSCTRKGVAIDLVLDRGNRKRSQFVFTMLKGGREAIFWQTARTARAARPAVRVPGRRASGMSRFTILTDTRERYPYRFARQQVDTERQALPAGDYGVVDDAGIVALVERKSLQDLVAGLVDGSLAFLMAELSGFPCAAVVVEDRYSSLFKHEHVTGGRLAELLARHQARYPMIPIVFCETRPLAEEWTYRLLGAACALAREHPEDPRVAPRQSPG